VVHGVGAPALQEELGSDLTGPGTLPEPIMSERQHGARPVALEGEPTGRAPLVLGDEPEVLAHEGEHLGGGGLAHGSIQP